MWASMRYVTFSKFRVKEGQVWMNRGVEGSDIGKESGAGSWSNNNNNLLATKSASGVMLIS